MKDLDLSKIIVSLVPLLLAAMWWVISSIGAINQDIHGIKAHLMLLIDPQGQIIASPGNAIARQELREEMMVLFHDLQVRASLLEAEVDRLKQQQGD